LKILIADDDHISLSVLEHMLRHAGYDVITAADGAQAIDHLMRKDGPRLALLDWMMPVKDGVEVCRELRGLPERAYTYIALLTSKEAKEDLVAGLDAGADDYLTKPCNRHELAARLRTGERILRLEDTLVKAREDMRFRAMHDPLTSLWNRGAILAHLRSELGCVDCGHGSISLLLCDVDHFKRVNDLHGHLVGDTVLREIALRLSAAVRPGDLVGRYGGEEFLAVLRNCGELEIAHRADEVRARVASEPIVVGPERLPLTISVGAMSIHANPRPDLQAVLGQVDMALYRAKASGRDCAVIVRGGEYDDRERRHAVPGALVRAGLPSGQHRDPAFQVRP
jgi:diguanylate cyclase (GGDEF)-like protein